MLHMLFSSSRKIGIGFFLFSLLFSGGLYSNIIDVYPGHSSVVLQKISDVPIKHRSLVVSVPEGLIESTLRVEYPLTLFWNLSKPTNFRSILMSHGNSPIRLKKSGKKVSILSVEGDRALVSEIDDTKTYFVDVMDIELNETFFKGNELRLNLPILRRPNVDVTLSYMIDTVTSKVSYYAFYDEKRKSLALQGYVYINNLSGQDFLKSKISLHVGEEKFLPSNRRYHGNREHMGMRSASSVDGSRETGSGDDYHVFEIQKIIDINKYSTTSLTFFSEKKLKAKKIYRFNAYKFSNFSASVEKPVDMVLSFSNTTGFPLPSGRIQLFKENAFIGEDMLPSLSKSQNRDIHFGKTVEITAKKELVKQEDIKLSRLSTFKISVTNNKILSSQLEVFDKIPANSKIIKADLDYTKESAVDIRFFMDIEAVKTTTIQYTISQPLAKLSDLKTRVKR
ncbi:hypothetical protein HOH45_01355 [bacterium]|nr:hypothetical protein [bacterium]